MGGRSIFICVRLTQVFRSDKNMRITVKVNGQSLVVPCRNGANTVAWLLTEALERSQGGNTKNVEDLEVRLAQGNGLLSKTDSIKDVLKDNDFVIVDGK